MYDLTQFALPDMTECSSTLRHSGQDGRSMQETADRIVRFFYERLVDRGTGEKQCALVRFFKSYPYAQLEPRLQGLVRRTLGGEPPNPAMRCLTLLATAGLEPAWNSREQSAGHQVMPLPSEQLVAKMPMISNLIQQFGLTLHSVVNPDPTLLVDLSQRTYNVFHVPEAHGSAFVPAQQEFVIPYGVRSVLGFGGVLPSLDLFAVILFARVPVPRTTADLFQTLSLSVKVAILPFAGVAISG